MRLLRNPVARRVLLIIAALAVAAYSTLQLRDYLAQQQHYEQVLVAKRDIPTYMVVMSDDIGYLQKPLGSRLPDAVQDPSQIIGKAAAMTILRGEEILPQKLMDSPLVIGPGERAIGIPVDTIRAVGITLKPGSIVDVYWLKQEIPEEKAQAIAYDATVLNILNKNNTSVLGSLASSLRAEGQSSSPANNDAPSIAVLKVKNSEVQNVITAVGKGSIYLAKKH